MADIWGLAKVEASDYQFMQEMQAAVGTDVIYDAMLDYMGRSIQVAQNTVDVFVQGYSPMYKERYKLPRVGKMQKSVDGAQTANSSFRGSWDVGYPLFEYGDAIGITPVEYAYMSPTDFQAHIDSVISGYHEALKDEILTALFQETQYTFSDNNLGDIVVEGLANGDSVVYPPAVGTNTLRSMNGYVVSTYTVANISDTNNPYATAKSYFTASYGNVTGGRYLEAYIHSSMRAKTEALTGFYEVTPNLVTLGDNESVANAVNNRVSGSGVGEFIGVIDGTAVFVWDYVPENYMVVIDPSQPEPVQIRIDPQGTGLGSGGLVRMNEYTTPELALADTWKARFGAGVRNRMNGYVMQFKASGTFDIPTNYAR